MSGRATDWKVMLIRIIHQRAALSKPTQGRCFRSRRRRSQCCAEKLS